MGRAPEPQKKKARTSNEGASKPNIRISNDSDQDDWDEDTGHEDDDAPHDRPSNNYTTPGQSRGPGWRPQPPVPQNPPKRANPVKRAGALTIYSMNEAVAKYRQDMKDLYKKQNYKKLYKAKSSKVRVSKNSKAYNRGKCDGSTGRAGNL